MFRSGGESIMPAPNFCLLEAGKVVDLRPMGEGKDALVFDNGSWVPFSGVLGQIFDAKPLTDEEAISMTS